MSSSTKLRVWVETKRWSSSATMRPTLLEVSTVPGIAALIFTTPCGTFSKQWTSADTASLGMTVSRLSHSSMRQVMCGSVPPYCLWNVWLMLSNSSFTKSEAPLFSVQITISPDDAIEALASPIWMSATSISSSLLITFRMILVCSTALQRPLLISTPEWPPNPPAMRMRSQRPSWDAGSRSRGCGGTAGRPRRPRW